METLFLGIFKDCKTQQEVKELICKEFEAKVEDVEPFTVLVAYVDYGSYEGTGWLLLQDSNYQLFENHSGHCSCFRNEGQFKPEPATIQYLQSNNFSCYCYDKEDELIKEFIQNKL
jgi:hypothetical protein